MLQQHRARQFLGTGRIGDPLLRGDLDVGIVVLDGGLERVIALVGHVVGGIVKNPADVALAADRLRQHVGRLLAHLEKIVSDDRRIVGALLVVGRHVRQENQLYARPSRLLERLRRGHRIERQRQDHVRSSGQRRLDVRALLRRVEPCVCRDDHFDAGPLELVGRTSADRVHEVRRRVPEKRRLVALALKRCDVGIAQRDSRRWLRAFPARPDRLRACHPGNQERNRSQRSTSYHDRSHVTFSLSIIGERRRSSGP